MRYHPSRLFKHLAKNVYQLAQRVQFVRSLRPSDVFLVSYPKSGRYWVGFFLATILSRRIPNAPQPLTLRTVYDLIPPVYIDGRNGSLHKYNWPEPRIFVSHGEGGYKPYLPRIIYLVRDPRDVMVSYYYHLRRVCSHFDLSLHDFIVENEMLPCDWGHHVREWLLQKYEMPWLLVKYEDLQSDPVYWFSRILKFSEVKVSDPELRRAVKQSSFESMRRLEEKYGMHKDNSDKKIRHVRRGEVGGWRDELEPRLVDIIQKRDSDLMLTLGYKLHEI